MAALFASAYPLLQLEMKKFLSEFAQLKKQPVEAGVGVEGPAAAYALVWEWGNARQHQIGPRTTVGTNPDGEKVFLSIQAPHGYIRVSEPSYWAALEQEMGKVSFSGTTPGAIREELEEAAEKICNRIRDIIKEHVPIGIGPGAGQLHDGIKTIRVGDALLDDSEDDNPLAIGGECE